LSSWLRDYLYIPLGGNRGTAAFTYRNIMITMLLGGLWHGAAWTFVAWGAIHGMALVVHKWWTSGKYLSRVTGSSGLRMAAVAALGWGVTMTIVGIAWVYFRAPSIGTAHETLLILARFTEGSVWIPSAPLIGMILLVLAIDVPQAVAGEQAVWLRWPWYCRGVTYAAAVLILVIWGSQGEVPFLYFQF
jgi:D-alanyl-lipoteichoic acid acyltransferase DltB (MBOAT superfamily)